MNGSTERSTRWTIDLPGRSLDLDRAAIMGILNQTPDSFYDRGRYKGLDLAVARAVEMAEEGADIVDVGGEKAGPGDPVSVEEELRRVVPVIEAVRREIALPISVDTFKPGVARRAVEAGADIINSISGFQDRQMIDAAAGTDAAIVIMHIQGKPRVANPNPHYEDLVAEVAGFLRERAEACVAAGIEPRRIIIDPGPGFGKTSQHDIALLRQIDRLTALPYPVLLAVSRKKFIGDLLGTGVDDRLEGSLAAAVWGVVHGVRIIRVHDVRATRRAVAMAEAVLHPERFGGHG